MDKVIAKSLERIQKLVDRSQHEKALQQVEELLESAPDQMPVIREELRIALVCRDWSNVLHRVKKHMNRHPLSDLLTLDARVGFMALVRDNAPFRAALLDHILNAGAFSQIGELMQVADASDRNWLTTSWIQLSEEIEDDYLSAAWQVAAGVGCFFNDDWDMAFSLWTRALARDPRFLKTVMGICQKSDLMDTRRLGHRLQIIRLILAAGKKDESLSLLQALGLESRENALQVLIEIPTMFRRELETRSVCQVRYTLALFLEDEELIAAVVSDMSKLKDDDLFVFQKQAMVNVQDKGFRRKVLLRLAEVYIRKESWESAAFLLESLHQEDDHPEIVALMEHVLDHYPILPKMHFMVAQYQVRNQLKENAIRHLTMIKDTGEYLEPISSLLENHLFTTFDLDYAEFLFDLLPDGSTRAALLAWNMLMVRRQLTGSWVKRMLLKAPVDGLDPFWALLQAQILALMGQQDQAVERVLAFISHHPELSPEVLRIAEHIVAKGTADVTPLQQNIRAMIDQLQPRHHWLLISKQSGHLNDSPPAQEPARAHQPSTAIAEEPPAADSTPGDPQESSFTQDLDEVAGFANSGEIKAAVQLAERLAERYPQRFREVIASLNNLKASFGSGPLWDRARMHVLIRAEAFQEAVDLGRKLLENEPQESQLAPTYQLLAFAYEGLGDIKASVQCFLQSSRDAVYFNRNKKNLLQVLLPDHADHLQDFLQLILDHQDLEMWIEAMEAWKRHAPDDVDEQLRWFSRFADHMNTPLGYLDLAKWAIKESMLNEARQALAKVDLKDPYLGERLGRVVEQFMVKDPGDAAVPFTLGRYHLIHSNIPKAVDLFRNLAMDVPKAGAKIYQYLRKFTQVHKEAQTSVTLYGLLLRIALNLGHYADAVKLLAEFGEKDQRAADSLADGVYRIIAEARDLEALLDYLALMDKWKAHARLIKIHAQTDFDRFGIEDRLTWLERATQDPGIAKEAHLELVRTLFKVHEYDRCAQAISQLSDGEQGEVFDILEKLVERFPDRLDLLRHAGWAAWKLGRYESCKVYFRRVMDSGVWDLAVEAFAMLRECGRKLPFKNLLAMSDKSEDQILGELRDHYGRLRLMDLEHWGKDRGSIPLSSLEWLMANHDRPRFAAAYEQARPFLEGTAAVALESALLRRSGKTYYAAMQLAQSGVPLGMKRSFYRDAGLLEQAILLKDEDDDPVAPWIRREFLAYYHQPKVLWARFSGMTWNHEDQGDPGSTK